MKLDTLKAGHAIRTNTGSYYLVLKVIGEVYVQDAFDGKWSTQSQNEEKTTVVMVWDGKFTNKKSLKEIDQLCDEILAPDNEGIFETLERINNNYK